MAESADTIRKKRVAAKAWLKREVNQLQRLLTDPNVNEATLSGAISNYSKRLNRLREIQEEVETHLSEDELEQDIEIQYEFISQCENTGAEARHRLTLFSRDENKSVSSQQDETEPLYSNAISLSSKSAHLPKIQIKTFSGEHTEWPSFRDKFNALIGDSNLPNITKFSYLQSLLSGVALASIEGLNLTAENYHHALDILEERFGRKERIVFDHIEQLLSMSISSTRNVKELWSLYNQLQAHVRSLENLDITREQYGVILTPLIISRLPDDVRLEWARHSTKRESDLTFLMEFLHEEILRRERSESFGSRVGSKTTASGGDHAGRGDHVVARERRNTKGTASALFNGDRGNSKPKCAFCSAGHYNNKCPKLSQFTIDEIKDKVRSNKLCFKCFKPSHFSRNCNFKCGRCAKGHNNIFCKATAKSNGAVSSEQLTSTDSAVHFSNTGEVQTFMQTCYVSFGGKERVCVLFDSGSDKSFISSSLVKSLKPKFVKQEETSLCSFGCSKPSKVKKMNVYELNVRVAGGKNERICLTEIEQICKPMFRPSVPNDILAHFEGYGLEWSDDLKKGREIKVEILIGLDHYWKLMRPGRVIGGPDGLVAQETVFGPWVISGSCPVAKMAAPPHVNFNHNQFLNMTSVSDEAIGKVWEIESLGIVESYEPKELSPAIGNFHNTVEFIDGRYQVALPWKSQELKAKLQDNLFMAKRRAYKLFSKIEENEQLREDYLKVSKDLEQKGIIHEVPSSAIERSLNQNLADIGTRGITARKLVDFRVWISGPLWLTNEESTAKREDVSVNNATILVCSSELGTTTMAGHQQTRTSVFPFARWGDFAKAIRVVAWVMRFLSNSQEKSGERNLSLELTLCELKRSKMTILQHEQQCHFSQELEALRKGNPVPRRSALYRFNPFVSEDGLVRLKGRLDYSVMSFESKHPVLIPKGHIAELIVRREHSNSKHGGVSQMISAVRNEFWIIGLRNIARKIKRQGPQCIRFDSQPCQQPMAPLPRERVERSPPFSVTGVDFAGPVYTTDFPGEKHYICLFTCGTIRDVHLELVDNLSTAEFMRAFRRFISRRGLPACIFSDQAKTFKSAAKQILAEYTERSPDWRFSKPRSPWVGGMWERMVRTVKSCLRKSIGPRNLPKCELITLLCEIEDCVNSRPLIFVGDTKDSVKPLTPNHFLKAGVDLDRSVEGGVHSDSATQQPAGHLQQLITGREEELEKFWTIWSEHYIKNLPHAPVAKSKGKLHVGSVVLIREDKCLRLYWPLGRVTKILPSRDGLIRTVEIKTARGTYIRPIQRLHILEVSNERDMIGVEEYDMDNDNDVNDNEKKTLKTRSGRKIKTRQVLDL